MKEKFEKIKKDIESTTGEGTELTSTKDTELTIELIAPHKKVSREVTKKDFKKVYLLGEQMFELCKRPNGVHNGAYAIAHPQVEEKKPLRFFVTAAGDCVINPVMTNHTKHKHIRSEGCLSFPLRREGSIGRYNKIEVEFYVFNQIKLAEGKLELEKMDAKLKGIEAQIWQHEIDHLDGVNIWGEYGESHTLCHLVQGATKVEEKKK